MWVDFVVGSLLCSERFFSGYSPGTSSCELLGASWVNKLHLHFLVPITVPITEALFPLFNFFGSINEPLLKMENQHNIQTRWLPSDVQYWSSLITTEAVKAKQTLDMMLVSGRRRWFLLSLKKKYAGTFSLLVWEYEISLIIIHSKYFPVSDWLKPHA